ncbi:MAG: hypothetical protein C4310_06285 [Chloroflexota bacterium]
MPNVLFARMWRLPPWLQVNRQVQQALNVVRREVGEAQEMSHVCSPWDGQSDSGAATVSDGGQRTEDGKERSSSVLRLPSSV